LGFVAGGLFGKLFVDFAGDLTQQQHFAVVADEVRKLAERTQKSLGEIEANANVLAQSINEMSESIKEQSDGINMINQSVTQIDSITHQNISVVNTTNDVTAEIDNMAKMIVADVRKNKF